MVEEARRAGRKAERRRVELGEGRERRLMYEFVKVERSGEVNFRKRCEWWKVSC